MKNEQEIIENYCRGCISLICFIGDNVNGECPCTNCLIKMICDDQCEEYKKYSIAAELKWGIENEQDQQQRQKTTKQIL
jgi:hypothetical protein